MTHDPMCPYFPEQQGFGGINSGVPSTQPYIPGVPCQCALIARVREDERGKQFVSDEALTRIAGGIAKATPVDEATWRQSTYDTGYAAALRDAVEAAKAATEAGPLFSVRNSGDPQRGWDAAVRHAVAAIEALGQITDPISDSPEVDNPNRNSAEVIHFTGQP